MNAVPVSDGSHSGPGTCGCRTGLLPARHRMSLSHCHECGGTSEGVPCDGLAAQRSVARPGWARLARTRQRGPPVMKILVIMEENHSSGMPYLWRLARRYGRAMA